MLKFDIWIYRFVTENRISRDSNLVEVEKPSRKIPRTELVSGENSTFESVYITVGHTFSS